MNEQRFERYTNGLTALAEANRQSAQEAAHRLEVTKTVNKLIKQTSWCDGSSTSATRTWLQDIDLAFGRVGRTSIIEIVSSTVTGPLRKEIERFLNDVIAADQVVRDAVPWAQVRAHVVTNFLNVDEAAALRDSLEQMHQSAYETDASFNRRFRDLADAAFPAPARNDDQHRLMVRAYARGQRSSSVAVKMIQDTNPDTLDAAILWVNDFSGRQDVVSRLGLDRPGVEPMDIGSVQPPTLPSTSSHPAAVPRRGRDRTGVTPMDIGSVHPPALHPPADVSTA